MMVIQPIAVQPHVQPRVVLNVGRVIRMVAVLRMHRVRLLRLVRMRGLEMGRRMRWRMRWMDASVSMRMPLGRMMRVMRRQCLEMPRFSRLARKMRHGTPKAVFGQKVVERLVRRLERA